jgi:hypothetical protein
MPPYAVCPQGAKVFPVENQSPDFHSFIYLIFAGMETIKENQVRNPK